MSGGSGGNAPNSGNGGGGSRGVGGNPARQKLNLDVIPAGQTPNALGDQLSQQLPPPAGVMPTQYPVLPAGQYANPPFYGQPGAAYPQQIQQPIYQHPTSPAGHRTQHPQQHQESQPMSPTEESTLKPGVKLFGQSFGLSFGLMMGVVTVFILIPMLLCGGCTALMLGVGAVGGVAERVSDQSRESEEIRREWERQQREIDEAARAGEGQ